MGDKWHIEKPTVRSHIFEDMKKYVKDLQPDDYIVSDFFQTSEAVYTFLREYYDSNLPVSLKAWYRVNNIDEGLTTGETIQEEVKCIFEIEGMFTTNYKRPIDADVIGTYIVCAVLKRPIYHISIEEYGLDLVLKKCSGNWRISIKSKIPIEFEYYELFDPKFKVYWYNEDDFPKESIYKSYDEDHCEFTIELNSNNMLFMYMYLLKYYLDHKKEENSNADS